MKVYITESRLRQIIRQCVNEAMGVHYDKELNNMVMETLFYMQKYNEASLSFDYDGVKYSVTTKPSLTLNGFFEKNNKALGYCSNVCGTIEIGINPRILQKYRKGIDACEDFQEFQSTQDYKSMEDGIEYVLTHELTHAQEHVGKIKNNTQDDSMPFDLVGDDNDGQDDKFNEDTSTKLESDIVYWFSSRERQARLSQGYIVVKKQLDTMANQFGEEFVKTISSTDVYNSLYNATETNYLDKLYNDFSSTSSNNLQSLLTKKSAIFNPRTTNLNYEYKRLSNVLNSIIEYNKKKLIKVAGMIVTEMQTK